MRRETSSVSGGITRLFEQVNQRQVGQGALRGNALAFGGSGDSGELIAGFFFVRFRQQLAQIGEAKVFAHNRCR
jgi:hypothetical protein